MRRKNSLRLSNLPARGVVLALLLCAAPAQAQENEPIDAALDACLGTAEGQTTAGMIDCTGKAIGAWDARLNETYRKAMATLDPKSRELLRTAQRRWLAFRAADQASMNGPWRAGHGSIMRVQATAAILSAIKERVAQLRLYFAGD